MVNNQTWRVFEANARKLAENYFNVTFPKDEYVEINGKKKKFDFVNFDSEIVGDAKHYSFTKSGNRPSAKFSTLNEYIWLLQKMPPNWTKFVVIGQDKELVQDYYNEFEPWLKSVLVFYSDGEDAFEKIS